MRRVDRPLRWLLVGSAAILLGACGTSGDTATTTTTVPVDLEDPSEPATTTTTTPSVDVTMAELDAVLGALARRVGTEEIEATSFAIYPGWVTLDARDRRQPNHIDRYEFRDGRVTGPEPVRFAPSQIPGRVFRLDRIVWESLPARLREAPKLAEVDGGYVSNVSAYFNGEQVLLTIRVESVRYGATIVLDERGRVLRTSVD